MSVHSTCTCTSTGMLSKPFGGKDGRLKVALDAPEPLIHFALVCGAKSCPPIKTYTAAVRDIPSTERLMGC